MATLYINKKIFHLNELNQNSYETNWGEIRAINSTQVTKSLLI